MWVPDKYKTTATCHNACSSAQLRHPQYRRIMCTHRHASTQQYVIVIKIEHGKCASSNNKIKVRLEEERSELEGEQESGME